MKPVKIVEKPWGGEIWIAHTDQYALKIITVKQGCRSSLQYHNVKAEHIYVDEGILEVEEMIDGVLVKNRYEKGDVVENPPLKQHRTNAITDVRLIEVSTPELDDVVRIEDDFGRA